MKQTLKSKHLMRYILAGALAYAVELSVLLCLHIFLSFSAELSTAIAFWFGLVTAFLLQKLFTFQNYQKEIKAISGQLTKYALLVGVNYIFTLAVVALFPSNLVIFSRTLALVIVTVWNYWIYKKIFRAKKSSNARKLATPAIRRKLIYGILLSLPVLAFFSRYLVTNYYTTPSGDYDYYAQVYEAFRISVLHFHQLPLWNPWMSGGLPLFANPQFGLFSLQSLLVLLFGTVYGLKLAFVIYALIGFWGMYFLCRRVLQSSGLRSALIGYIWVFCGFFAYHNIGHYTFTSFFLLPWLFYFVARRRQKWSWLWFGLVESIIILSSVHYAFLMTTLVVVIFSILSVLRLRLAKDNLQLRWQITRIDVLFVLKTFAVIFVLAGYRLVTTYYFVMHNEKSQALLSEPPNDPIVLLKALFWPVGPLAHAPKTFWGWGEYSMYIGIGVGFALLLCIFSLIRDGVIKHKSIKIKNWEFVVYILIIGFMAIGLAGGDFSKLSPFSLLHSLPGFTQTRVPSRWLMLTMFAILVFLSAWPRNKKTINLLLALSAIELFLTFGPLHIIGSNEISLPKANFSSTFTQYDNGRQHLGVSKDLNKMYSYYYTTEQNIGQIYADDSLIDTIHTLNTHRCGSNDNPSCNFVLTHNALVTYWSPNKIMLKRTAPGPIKLDMNVEKGWRINNVYPFSVITKLDPTLDFVLPKNANNYTLEYAPKLSPSWIAWRIGKL